MITPITCDTIGTLDGGAARLIIDAAIRDAVRDLDDRGDEDGKPRKVEIHLTFVKLDNSQVAVHLEATPKMPRRRTAGTIGAVRSRAGSPELFFNDMATDAPDQRTIDEYEGDGRGHGGGPGR